MPSLSFDPDNNNSQIVAVFDAYHSKNSKLVYYNKKQEQCQLEKNDRSFLLRLQYGKTATRYNKNTDQLRLDPRFCRLTKPLKGEFYPLLMDKERTVHYIFGMSGSGKSYLAKKLSKYYSKFTNVFLLSPVQDSQYSATNLNINDLVELDNENDYEEQLKEYKEAKIKLKYKKKMIDDPMVLMDLEMAVEDLKPKKQPSDKKPYKLTDFYHKLISKGSSLFIYDDTEATPEQDKLQFLQKVQLLTGRHDNINMIILNHMANSGMKTRDTINESHMFTLFNYNRYSQYFMKNYMSMENKEMNMVKEMLNTSRFVTVYPRMRIAVGQDQVISF